MCNEHDTSEQYYLKRSTKLCKRKPHLRQQNNRSKSYSNKPTSPPLVNGHTNYFSLTGDGCHENGHEDNDGVEEDKNSSQSSRVLVDSVAHADYSYDKDIGNSDDAVGESNGSEKKDGHCILNGDSSKDAECQTGGVNQLGDRHGHDVDGNDDANIGSGNADHDDDNDGANAASTVKNDDDSDENSDNGCNGYHNLHHLHLNPVPSLLQLHVSLLLLLYTLNPGSHGGIGTLRNLRRGITPTTLMRTGVIGDLRMTLRNLLPHRLLHLCLLMIPDKMNFPCLISRAQKPTTGLMW